MTDDLRDRGFRSYRPPPPRMPKGRRARNDRLMPNDLCPCGSGQKFKRCHRDASPEERAQLGPRAPNLDEVLDVARPLLMDVGVKNYPLFRAGSCFLVTFRGDLWVVSSAHAFKNFKAKIEDARVLASIEKGTPRFLRLVSQLEPLDDDPHDTAWLDFVLIRSSESSHGLTVVDLDRTQLAPLDGATSKDSIRICGFPDGLDNGIEYPEKNIAVGRFNADGTYRGPTESKFVHAVDFESFGKVTSINNMSGGPAFFARPAEGKWWFAGVVVNGSVESKSVRFIDARAILKTLVWHYDADPSASVDPSKRGEAWLRR